MAGPYGNTAHILQILAVDGTKPGIAERLDALNATVSLLVESELGREFGATAADSTVLVWAANSSVLVLPRPIRAVTTLTVGGTVSGSTMTGGTVYDATYWTPDITDIEGNIYALRLLSGGWWGEGVPITITGQWAATDNDAEPPADLVYAVDALVAKQWRMEQASTDGFIGPDAGVQVGSDLWQDPIWLKVKEKYEVSTRELVL